MAGDPPTPSTDSGSSCSDDMAQYVQVYLDESAEELDGLVEAVLQLEANPRHEESLHKAFRMLHSLKGSSGLLGFEVIGGFAHELESRFEHYRSGQSRLNRETTTLILQCVDFFRSFLERLRQGEMSEGDPSHLLQTLRALEQNNEDSRQPPPQETATAGRAQPAPAHPAPATPDSADPGGLKVVVRFRPGLQLADLKARLIASRLSTLGEIIASEPSIEDSHSFEDLPLFSLTIVTDQSLEEIRRVAKVDGVESVEILTSGSAQDVSDRAEPGAAASTPAIPMSDVAAVPSESVAASAPSDKGVPEPESAESRGAVSETLRVDIGRLDQLMNLTGELVVANARFGQIVGDMSPTFRRSVVSQKSGELIDRIRQRLETIRRSLDGTQEYEDVWMPAVRGIEEDLEGLNRHAGLWEEGRRRFADISDAVDQLGRVSRNLQRGVLDTRMVPVGPLFNRFRRVIRDLSVERGKQVQLVLQGEKTELDKRMIDALGDPLLHLVRNSIDHGLESPEVRRASGKAPTGTIVLEASHRGNSVWITVRDDGAGIRPERIRARVVERGLATAAQAQGMTDEQLIDYIWHPGFSTAEAVTGVSGRGVGMDIVHNAISELSGTIRVTSTPGEGTSFTIRLPLTLVIIHSLLVRFREDCFSIPIDEVREIVSIPQDRVHDLHGRSVIDVRGELIPLVRMQTVFQWSGTTVSEKDAVPAGSETCNVVIIHARGRTLGLAVDTLAGRTDLVIKSLAENFRPVRGLSGAGILGDGSVCLMLDSAALFELAAEPPAADSSPVHPATI